MEVLEIRLFGTFGIRRHGQEVGGFESAKVQALLAYVLLHPGRHHRESLAELLWPDSTETQQRKYLRQAIWRLQNALRSACPSDAGPVIVTHDWLQRNAELDLTLDVQQFERAFTHTQDVAARDLDESRVQMLEAAVSLYQGDLLEGWYEDWCHFERERLQNMLLVMLDKLMRQCEVHHRYEAGLEFGGRILRFDRAREQTHRRLMRLHCLAGDRTAALRQFATCESALAEELGVKPSRRTLALLDQIKSDVLDEPESEAALGAGAQPATLSEILSRLKELRSLVTSIERRVQFDIASVELALLERE